MTEDETIKNQPEPKAADTPELSDEQEAITPQIRAEDAARLVFEPAERSPRTGNGTRGSACGSR